MINSVCGIRSTGRICTDLADVLKTHGHECRIAYGRENVPEKYRDISFRIGSDLDVRINAFKARLMDNEGFNAKKNTKKLLAYMDEYAPDLVHLHNLHGYYLNMEMLINYLAERDIPVVFTLHDCWMATGHCSHFTVAGCYKWHEGCHSCPQIKRYPSSFFYDRSKKNWSKKKELMEKLSRVTYVTPSEWLAGVMKQSHLKERSIIPIPNGVDLDTFVPTESDFRDRYGLENKKIVLGVATAWSGGKGLDEFIELQSELGEDYQVVLVGLTPDQLSAIPKNIIGIERTNSISELAGLYTAADVFVNAGKEETMGLTTVEAMACGTPVVASNMTAVPEVVDENGGLVFEEYSVKCMAEKIRLVVEGDYPNTRRNAEKYEKKQQYEKYIALYEKMVRTVK